MGRLAILITTRLRSAALITRISFRNLLRQFRRNLLLAAGIAVGMCVLVVTMSFTNGLTDILFNKVMVYVTGHIRVVMHDYTSRRTEVIRDQPRFLAAIKQSVEGIVRIDEDVSAFGRSVGNGKTGMVILVGLAKDSDFYDEMQLDSGDPRDIFKPDVFPGIVFYRNAARDINVGMNDTVTVRFDSVYGQAQAPKFRVVGIIRSENMFMDVAAFVDMEVLRGMLNLKPSESLGLNIVTAYPQDARKVIAQADKIHAALGPEAAGVKATVGLGAASAAADVFALKLDTDDAAARIASEHLRFTDGGVAALAADRNGIVLTESLAGRLGAAVGAKVLYSYLPKYADAVESELTVVGIASTPASFADLTAFAHEDLFYRTFFWNIPKHPAAVSHAAPLYRALVPEWELLVRSPNSDAALKTRQRLNRESWKGAKVDVQTMFENASMIVDFQKGLNTVSLVAVLVLFVVILIGVVNTMRMSIRERTREIGTNRAIGMQRSDVRSVFVLEIVFLAAVACAAGLLLACGVMALLAGLTVDLRDNPFNMFFVNQHIYFVPTAGSVVGSFVTIVLVAWVIAFFTARRAARMRVADALRHYE